MRKLTVSCNKNTHVYIYMLSIGLHTLIKTNSEINYLSALKSNSDVPARNLMFRYGLMEKHNLKPSAPACFSNLQDRVSRSRCPTLPGTAAPHSGHSTPELTSRQRDSHQSSLKPNGRGSKNFGHTQCALKKN